MRTATCSGGSITDLAEVYRWDNIEAKYEKAL